MTPALSYMLYILFVLGGIGLFLAMPRAQGSKTKTGFALGLLAIFGLLVFVCSHKLIPHSHNIAFYFAAGVAILAAGRAVSHPVPVYSAVYFGLVILSVAILLVIHQAEFLGIALVIIYAGAILVVYAFVIMLAQQKGKTAADTRAREPFRAIAVSFVLMGAVAGQFTRLSELPDAQGNRISVATAADMAAETTSEDGAPLATRKIKTDNTLKVGRLMFGKYVVVVELAGLLLLVAMIGAIAVARKRVPLDDASLQRTTPLGQIGREVPPN